MQIDLDSPTWFERLIAAIIYAVVGILLGYAVALFFVFIDTNYSSQKIIFFSMLICMIIGFLFPYHLPRFLVKIWKFLIM